MERRKGKGEKEGGTERGKQAMNKWGDGKEASQEQGNNLT